MGFLDEPSLALHLLLLICLLYPVTGQHLRGPWSRVKRNAEVGANLISSPALMTSGSDDPSVPFEVPNPDCPVYSRGLVGPKRPGSPDCVNVTKEVEELADRIIAMLIKREELLLLNISQLVHMMAEEHELFHAAYASWEASEPAIRVFLRNITAALDAHFLINEEVTRQVNFLAQLANGTELEPPPLKPDPGSSGEINVRYSPLFMVPTEHDIARRYNTILALKGERKRRESHYDSETKRKLTKIKGRSVAPKSEGSHRCRKISGGSGSGSGKHSGGSGGSARDSEGGGDGSGNSTNPGGPGGPTNPGGPGHEQCQVWYCPMMRVIEQMDGAVKWFTFLEELHEKLSSLEVQNMRLKRTLDFTNWNGSANVSKENLEEALRRLTAEFKLTSWQDVIPTLVETQNRYRRAHLGDILGSTIIRGTSCSRDGHYMNVTGSYVFTSEVLDCFNQTEFSSSSHIHTLLVVSVNKLFLDADIVARSAPVNKNRTFDMVVVSPNWVAVKGEEGEGSGGGEGGGTRDGDGEGDQTRRIDLSGHPGGLRPKGTSPGSPGLPGEPGGNFFGIAEKVTGKVEIISAGGKGGRGVDGYRSPVDRLQCDGNKKSYWLWKSGSCLGYSCECVLFCLKDFKVWPVKDGCPEWCVRNCCVDYSATKYYRQGHPGGKAGIAGKGGQIVSVHSAAAKPLDNIRTESKDGEGGEVGKGIKGESVDANKITSEEYNLILQNQFYPPNDPKFKNFWCVPRIRYERGDWFKKGSLRNGKDGEDPRQPPVFNRTHNFTLRTVTHALLEYKKEFRRTAHLFNFRPLVQFLDALETNETLDGLWETIDFVQELLDFEYVRRNLSAAAPLVYYYNSIAARAIARDNKRNNTRGDDQRALLFVYRAAESRKLQITNPFEPIHVVNFQDFVAHERRTIKSLQRTVRLREQYLHISRITQNYNDGVLKYLEEAINYQENVLFPELEANREYLQSLVQYIIDEIERLKAQGEAALTALQWYRLQLIGTTILDTLYWGIDVATNILSMFITFTGLITQVLDFAKEFVPTPTRPNTRLNIPPIVYSGSAKQAYRFRRSVIELLRGFLLQLNVTKTILDFHPEAFAVPLQEIERYNASVIEALPGYEKPASDWAPQDLVDSFTIYTTTNEFVIQATNNISKLVGEAKDVGGGGGGGGSTTPTPSTGGEGGGGARGRSLTAIRKGHKTKSHNKGRQQSHRHRHRSKRSNRDRLSLAPPPHNIRRRQGEPLPGFKPPITEITFDDAVGYAQTALRFSTQIYNTLKRDIEAIREVENSIKGIAGTLELLRNYQERLTTGLLGEFDDLFTFFSELTNDLEGRSKVALETIKWRITSVIRDAKLELSEIYFKGFEAEKYITRSFERIEETLETMINIFLNVQDYQAQASLANFTAQVSLEPGYYLTKLQDDILEEKVVRLRFLLQAGVLVKRHQLLASSFRLWRFPFVSPSLCDLNIGSLDVGDPGSVESFSTLLTYLDDLLDGIQGTVVDVKQALDPNDRYTLQLYFHHDIASVPIYTWTNATSGEDIAILMLNESNQRSMVAPADKGPSDCDAVKFNMLYLNFTSVTGDKDLEEKLKADLESYAVTMLHHTNQYYRFANETYVLPAAPIELHFSFKTLPDGTPAQRNLVYDKLLTGDLTLSPFGVWTIGIHPVYTAGGAPSLEPYIYQFNMSLVGHGTCVLKTYALENDYRRPDCSDYNK